MIWPDNISFDGYRDQVEAWCKDPNHFIGDPPIDAQFALDLIFKTLIDDKANYEYLTTIPESAEQTNSIMLELVLGKYSRKFRRFKKQWREQQRRMQI